MLQLAEQLRVEVDDVTEDALVQLLQLLERHEAVGGVEHKQQQPVDEALHVAVVHEDDDRQIVVLLNL